MDYSISPEQLDKLIKPFFDKEFKHAKWGEHNDSYGGGTWYGFLNQDDVMLVGYPSHDSDIYFTNGQHFSDMWQFFSIDGKEFNEAMGRYIKKKYGSDFNRIM
jgi:hypothetical protein